MQDIEFVARISRWRREIRAVAADMDSTTIPGGRGVPFDKAPLLSAFEKSVKRLELDHAEYVRAQQAAVMSARAELEME